MKGACFPFFLEHYHGMIGKDQTAYFRETPSGKIIIAKYNRDKANNRTPSAAEIEQRNKFREAHEMAIDALKNSTKRPTLEAEYKAQSKYTTLLGYVTAKMYKSLG